MTRHLLAIGLAALFSAATAQAQSYPTRPVTIIVPYPAGGPTDQVARQIAPKLAAKLGQSFVVENVSGGGTNIAGQRVARSAPDGTMLFIHNLQISANVALYKSLPFDTEKDFLPIAMINSNPLVLVGRKTLEAKTLPELVAWMKKNPARIGHPGSWLDRASRHGIAGAGARRRGNPHSLSGAPHRCCRTRSAVTSIYSSQRPSR